MRCLKISMYTVFGLATISEKTKILSKMTKLVQKSAHLSVKVGTKNETKKSERFYRKTVPTLL